MIEGSGSAAELAERFERALYAIARSWRNVVDRRLQYLGASMTSWMTIAAALQVRSPLSQSELADMLSVSGATMVHMIDCLVEAGLVKRKPSISDRRVWHIVVTDAGRRLYAELNEEVAVLRQQLLASIELAKIVQLTELLEQLQSEAERSASVRRAAPPPIFQEPPVVPLENLSSPPAQARRPHLSPRWHR
jgi:DNA-binding MarR family transcriptional regulator